MTLLTILLLIATCALSSFYALSTKSKDRQWLKVAFVVVWVLSGIVVVINTEANFDFFMYLISFGIVLPRLIANIINQNRLESPVVFIKRKQKTLQWILVFIFWSFLTVIVLQPHRFRVSDGAPIYDEDYFRSLIGFLILLIPSVIFMIIAVLQRTAFCRNGLFHDGLLLSWSDFKSYSWKNEWLEMEKRSVKDKIQVLIPVENKEAVKELLRIKFGSE
jgi:hypothetical protein